jgi:glycosyltransferase A (GT-A) superfamily protein (DUF2064 family)
MRLLVLAKAPEPGRSKTRLQPWLTPHEAAAVAEAALLDTLDAVMAVPDVAVELVLDGAPGAWLPAGLVMRPQVPGDLAMRIEAALGARPGPALLIGMDTPQVSAAQLRLSAATLELSDAALGLSTDGGWWALGLRDAPAHAHLVRGIATSEPTTGAAQRDAILAAGLSLTDLPVLTDVDTPDDAERVAGLCAGRFADLVGSLLARAA